jgi:transaldolase / glucose-6-phosphate isomerase
MYDVCGNDRLFVSMHLARDEDTPTAKQLASLGEVEHPVACISIPESIAFGGEFFRWELATATAGAIIHVNPFDEPNVAESKQNTLDLSAAWQRLGAASEEQPIMAVDGMTIYGHAAQLESWPEKAGSMRDFLQAFVGLMEPPDSLALLAYFQRTPIRHEALQVLCCGLRNRLEVATTLEYGPRSLHSTGQLHKGGQNTGVFIMFTTDALEHIPIPGQTYFATLQRPCPRRFPSARS